MSLVTDAKLARKTRPETWAGLNFAPAVLTINTASQRATKGFEPSPWLTITAGVHVASKCSRIMYSFHYWTNYTSSTDDWSPSRARTQQASQVEPKLSRRGSSIYVEATKTPSEIRYGEIWRKTTNTAAYLMSLLLVAVTSQT
jgi:hypothetical protein